jgi:hypothetical protein
LLVVDATGALFETTGGDAVWSSFVALDGGGGAPAQPGDVLDAGYAMLSDSTNYVIITGDGRSWWTRRAHGSGTWQPWLNLETTPLTISGPGISVTTTTTIDVGTFARIAAGVTTEGLHILGITTNGRIWHQIRSSAGPVYRDVEIPAGNVGRFTTVACG